MSDFRFKPVRGTDKDIQNARVVDGAVHFAYDTKKIYFDYNGKHVPMGGNSGIYYGTVEEMEEDIETFNFTIDDIEGDNIPNAGDLILNMPNGYFFKVVEVVNEVISTDLLTVAGGGGNGSNSERPQQKMNIKIDGSKINSTSLVNGQSFKVPIQVCGEIAFDGSLTDETVILHWELKKGSGSDASTYWTGQSFEIPVSDIKGKWSETEVEIGPYLLNNEKTTFVAYVTSYNVEGKSGTKTLLVETSELSLSYKSGFSAASLVDPNNIIMSCNVKGSVDRYVVFTFDDYDSEERLLIGDNATTEQSWSVPSTYGTHGPHKCTIELYQAVTNSAGEINKGALADSLSYEIAVIESGNMTPVVWLGEYKEEYYNYDNILIPYLVYDPSNTSEAIVHLKKSGVPISGSPRTINTTELKWNYFEITDAEIDRVNNYSIDCDKGDDPRRISFTVKQDPLRTMEYAKSKNLRLLFDAKGRSNAESPANRASWVSEDGAIKATFKDFNWYNNGWILDENKQTCLRISNGAEFSLPIGSTTFASNSTTAQSHAVEIQFKIKNIQDYGNLIKNITRYKYQKENDTISDEAFYKAFGEQTTYNNYDAFLQAYLPVWSQTSDIQLEYDDLLFSHVEKIISLDKAVCKYLYGNIGLCLGPQDAFFSNGTNTVNINYVENDMVYLTAVYDHSSTNKLMYIYINGVITGVISSTVDGSWTVDTDNIVFNSNYCDIDLYKIRVYNTALNVNDVVMNHAVDKKDVLIYDQNKLAEENGIIKEYQFKFENMIKYNENHPTEPLMPYIIYETKKGSNDKLPFSKAESVVVGVEFVNTVLDAAYAKGELLTYAIEDGLCTESSSETAKTAAVKTYYKHHCPSWKGDWCNLDVQGTSSEFYPRRNYKIKTKTNYQKNTEDVKDKMYHILLHKGPFAEDHKKDLADLEAKTIKYGEESTRQSGWYMDNYTNSTDRWTMKVDYMESSGSYNAGFASMVQTAYSKHPLEDYLGEGEEGAFYDANNQQAGKDGAETLLKSPITGKLRWQDFRTSLQGFPVLAFHKKSNGEYLYIGMYRMLLDKGSDDVLGFNLPDNLLGKYVGDKVKKKAECWEFCNNSRGFCSYRDPWKRVELSFKPPEGTPDKEAYTSTGAPIIADNIEYRYNDKEDAIDAVVNLTSMTDKQKEAFLEETGLTSFNPGDEEDKAFARDWLLGVYSNWEKLNKWVWSTNIDNVVSEGTYKPVNMYSAKYTPGTYYREVKQDITNDDGSTTTKITYQLEDSAAIFNDGKDWWDEDLVEERVVYYSKREEKNDKGEVTSTTYVPVSVITQEVLATQPQGENIVKSYIYEKDTFYVEVEGAYSISTDDFRDSETYYELIVGDYQSKSDLLVRKLNKEKDPYIAGETYYYYDGNVKIEKVGDPGSLAVSQATDIVDEASYLNAFNGTRSVCVAHPVKYGRKEYTHDTKEYRAAKFVNELEKHFDIEYLATYFILTEVFECYDSRGKNCMMASWGPLEEGGDYIWYPIFYDIDTQLGINNTGIPSFEYNVDATVAGNYSTSDSLLWNNFYKYFKNSHILNKYKHLRGVTEGVSWAKLQQPTLQDINTIEKWYNFDRSVNNMIACGGVRPLIAKNLDMWWKYITITNGLGVNDGTTGWLGRNGAYEVDNNGTYFYALQGDRSQSRRQFLTSRLEYIDSWLNQGNYKRGGSNNIRGRVAANNPANTSDLWVHGSVPYYNNTEKSRKFDAEYWINLKPIRSSYVTVSDDAAAYPSQKYDGVNPVKFEITAIKDGVMNSAGYPEQLLYIYGMNQMADLGEMHNLYWQEFDLTGDATHLTTLKLGTDELMEIPENDITINNATSALPIVEQNGKRYYRWYNKKMNQPSIPASKNNIYGGMPLLKEVNLSNITVSTGSPVLDFSSCEKLQNFRAAGSNFVQFKFAEGVALHTLHLPNTITTLELVEANLLTTLLKEYNYPTRDELGHLNADKGLWVDGLFNTNTTNLTTINLKGGALKYGSYELLKKVFDIKQAQENQSVTKVQMTNVEWSPYIQLVEGDTYIEADSALYYKDNGHMRLEAYVYNKDTFNRDVLNGEIYKFNPNLDNASQQITDTSMFSDMMESNKWVGIGDNAENPNITGIVYIHNTTPVNEYTFRTSIGAKFPHLTFFFANVTEAYTAKFIIQDETGVYTYATMEDGTKGIETIQTGWFKNPYGRYEAEKDSYDFKGWSTSNNPEDIDAIIGSVEFSDEDNNEAWRRAGLDLFKENQTTYIFYAIFTITKYDITFHLPDGQESLVLQIPHGEPLRGPAQVPYKDDSQLEMYERYTFKGYATSASSSKVVDLSKDIATRPTEFWAVFEKESVYKNATSKMYFNFTTRNDYNFGENGGNCNGVYISLNPEYELRGKVTLPTTDLNNNPVIGIADNGFKTSEVNHQITHIFWEPNKKADIVRYGAHAFNTCETLKYIELPETLKRIEERAFYDCGNLNLSEIILTNLYYLGERAFGNVQANNISIIIGSNIKHLGERAFQNMRDFNDAQGYVALFQLGNIEAPITSEFVSTPGGFFREGNIAQVDIYCTAETEAFLRGWWNNVISLGGHGPSSYPDPTFIY